jgi:hypothetical protein
MPVSRNDYVRAAAGFVTGGPIGTIVSPLAGRLFNDNWTAWALVGVVAGPLSWAMAIIPLSLVAPPPPTASNQPAQLAPAQPATPDPAAPPQPANPAQHLAANTTVSDSLNSADQLFANGMDGCSMVSMAITAANSPQIYGLATQEQRSELKRYAERCNLRF